jgi:hypothetical protein
MVTSLGSLAQVTGADPSGQGEPVLTPVAPAEPPELVPPDDPPEPVDPPELVPPVGDPAVPVPPVGGPPELPTEPPLAVAPEVPASR